MTVFNTRNSWCEKVIFVAISLICIILVLDYKFALLPFHGGYLIAYLIFIIITTTWITFICLQNLLQNDKPFEYNAEKNTFLKFGLKLYNICYENGLRSSKQKLSIMKTKESNLDPGDTNQFADTIDSKVFQSHQLKERITKTIDERIDHLVKDIEVRFIIKWYVHISDDPSFPSECKVLLDEVIRRFLQVIVEVDGRKLIYGCIIVFLKHLKEFRKAVKRSQKSDGTIEDLYRYAHVGSKSVRAMEHFVFNLTANILRQFINWELWNSLPCRSLISILSRRFTTYILTYISSPGFLNYKIVQTCSSDTARNNLNLNKYCFISLSDVDHSGVLKQLQQPNTLCADVKERNFENLKNDESNTPVTSPRKICKNNTPDSINGLQFDVVDSCKQIKSTENSVQNGTTAIPLLNKLPKENHTLVAKVETKTGQATKIVDAIKTEVRPKASEPVKIHESKSANKTWRNSSDLECISLGQDLLAFQEFTDPDSQIQELIEKKLWKDNTDPVEDEKSSSMWDIPESWYEEEANDVIEEVAMSPTTNFQNYLKSTANTANTAIGNVTASTLHNMKELQQTTVNTVNTVVKPVSQATSNAMHKIGDLQDEAAGMVEGILDFGIAGLRKGLRLTGLQENFSELTQKAKNEFQKPDGHKPIDIQKPIKITEAVKVTEPVKINEKDVKKGGDVKNHKAIAKLIKTPHVASEEKPEQPHHSSSESDESVWINPLSKESPSFDGHILLEKTPDSLPKSILMEMQKIPENLYSSPEVEQKPLLREIPQITEEVLLVEDSPDPEYEEPQDFATTIAKLRTLLQQKSSESGLTTPTLSPMPQDDMAKTPNEPPPTDLTKVDGAMPSLYKFCARTATGVFHNTLNTIKTALPGNVNESNQGIVQSSIEDWTFVEADAANNDFYTRMKKLLTERRAFCTVDTAYEAIDSLEVTDQPDTTWTAPATTQYDDEQDEFDLQVPITKALVDIVCELIGDTNTCFLQEPVVKAILLLTGNYSEEYLTKQADSLLHNVNKYVDKLPENMNQDVMAMKLDEMVKTCMEVFPGYLKKLLGDGTVETGVELFITSLQSQRINQDIFIQIFELFASELISTCSQVSPAYSA